VISLIVARWAKASVGNTCDIARLYGGPSHLVNWNVRAWPRYDGSFCVTQMVHRRS
jgi:hypothetical protein